MNQKKVKDAQKLVTADLSNKEAKSELQKAYTNELLDYVNRKIEIISNASEDQKSLLAWKTVNEITGRKNTPSGKIKADSPAERLQKWKEHFQNLLGKPPKGVITPVIHELLPINTDEFTKCINRATTQSMQHMEGNLGQNMLLFSILLYIVTYPTAQHVVPSNVQCRTR